MTYSNQAKHEMLGVPLSMLKRYGAVNAEVAAGDGQRHPYERAHRYRTERDRGGGTRRRHGT